MPDKALDVSKQRLFLLLLVAAAVTDLSSCRADLVINVGVSEPIADNNEVYLYQAFLAVFSATQENVLFRNLEFWGNFGLEFWKNA